MRIDRRHGRFAAVAAALTALLAAAACGGGGESGGGAGKSGGESGGKITLTLDTFGNFGYKALIDQYQQAHPNIKIEHRIVQRFEDQYLPRMTQWLNAGRGAGDVIGIDEGAMGLMAANPGYFTDLAQFGLDKRESEFPPFKWQAGINSEGKLFALGTDVGGLNMCYRKDLFEKAGLPTDREEVAKLWPDWNGYLETGKKFAAKNTGKDDPKFVDGPNTVYEAVLAQEAAKNGNITYFDKQNQLVVDKNPAVKAAFDYVQQVSKAGLTAKLRAFDPTWDTGFKKGQFATIACPSWMLGIIEEKTGAEGKGQWDVAAVPGGGGNWGGSWLAVPKQSKHPKEAADLLNFLTSKDGHIGAFKEAKGLPSSLPAQQDAAVTGLTSEYFNNAPVGKIFTASVTSLQPVFLGKDHAAVKAAVGRVVEGMDQGSIKYDQAWQRFLDAGKSAAR
ncbi:ABC transporter substrate-binding protein [Bailinhaonella thermotolerans]|uniref:Extracellular solute-binding protein n=1 Tax=Bailinhaonella thermotolerans TaxID=1070861 RepID=A0A3A4BKL6_9ACTN|nr:extracellular solute-binding protein [Bailinhaonella thermotolerans]RJL31642.1 extracellular solute-binding protein [Bailinhaonella thermotolerans]